MNPKSLGVILMLAPEYEVNVTTCNGVMAHFCVEWGVKLYSLTHYGTFYLCTLYVHVT